LSETCVTELAILVGKIAHVEASFLLSEHRCREHNDESACRERRHWQEMSDARYNEIRDTLRRCKFAEGVE